jgi:hypothetical protein
MVFFFLKIPFQRSYWFTSCTLGILQSHTLRTRALFVSLITKCNLPYKYNKNSLQDCYKVLKNEPNNYILKLIYLQILLENQLPLNNQEIFWSSFDKS